MTKLHHAAIAVAALAAFSLGAGSSAEAGCFKKSASGTNTTVSGAKSQVYEALLQSFDWGAWASWMATGSTPGYRISGPSYSCKPGGLGYNCVGSATICKS
jgi:hypothetical protein